MKLFVILSLISSLALASGTRLLGIKHRRESKWDVIHHEYHGPPAPLSKDGRVIDTKEVAEAKANHLAIHAETTAELARLMADANALDVKINKEEPKAEEKVEEVGGGELNPESTPIVAEPVEMTAELMAMLTAAVAAAPKEQAQQEAPSPAVETAPAAENFATQEASEAKAEQPVADAAPDQQVTVDVAKVVEKPVVEYETNNEVDAERTIMIPQRNYVGPMAPLNEDGQVMDTFEVRKAKEAHHHAYEQAIKLVKAKQESKKEENSSSELPAHAWYEQRKKIYVAPVYHFYHLDGPVGYKGPKAPLGLHGRVVDTEEVEREKMKHKKAYEHAEAVAKRHPPKPEDNAV